jgi:ubiquinone/menaquinone biosynthesis C-methylase UbiE
MSDMPPVPNPRREIFNNLAPAWDSMCALKPEQAKTLSALVDGLAIAHDSSVLDVGCGTGVLVPYVLPHLGEEGRYTGLDVSDGMVAQAKRKYGDPRLSFVAEDLYEYRSPEPRFDLAMVFSAFPHLPDKPAALDALARLVKPAGRLCIAHVESSQAINAYHSGRVVNEVLRSDYLPSLDEMRVIIDLAPWRIIRAEDREGLYLLVLERRDGSFVGSAGS